MATHTAPQPSTPNAAPQPLQTPEAGAKAEELYAFYQQGGSAMLPEHVDTLTSDLAGRLQALKDSDGILPAEVAALVALHGESQKAINRNAKNGKARAKALEDRREQTLDALIQTSVDPVHAEGSREAIAGALDRFAILPAQQFAIAAKIDQEKSRGTFSVEALSQSTDGVEQTVAERYRKAKDDYIVYKARRDAPGLRGKKAAKEKLAKAEEELAAATQAVTDELLMSTNITGDHEARASYFLNQEALSIADGEREMMRDSLLGNRTLRSAEDKAEMSTKKKIIRAVGQAAVATGVVVTAGLTGGVAVLAAVPAVRAWRGKEMFSTRLAKFYGKFEAPELIKVPANAPKSEELTKEFIERGQKRTQEAKKAYRNAAIISLGITAAGVGAAVYVREAADLGLWKPASPFHNPLRYLGLANNHPGHAAGNTTISSDNAANKFSLTGDYDKSGIPGQNGDKIAYFKAHPDQVQSYLKAHPDDKAFFTEQHLLKSPSPSPTPTTETSGTKPSPSPSESKLKPTPSPSNTPATSGSTPNVNAAPASKTGPINLAEVSSHVSYSAETISNNEGFYNTMDGIYDKIPQLQGMNQHDYYQIHLRVGAKLEHMKFPNGEPMAYRVHDAKGNLYYGFGSTGKLSPNVVQMFIEEGAKQKGVEVTGSPQTGLMENVQFSKAAEIVGHGESLTGQVKDLAPQLHELGINPGNEDYTEIVNKIGGVFEQHGLARYTGGPNSHLVMIEGKHIPDSVLREAVESAAQSRGIDLASMHNVIEQTHALDFDNFLSKAAGSLPEHAANAKLSDTLAKIPEIKEMDINVDNAVTMDKLGTAIHASHPNLIQKNGDNWVFTGAGKLNKDSLAAILNAAAKQKGTTAQNLFALAA